MNDPGKHSFTEREIWTRWRTWATVIALMLGFNFLKRLQRFSGVPADLQLFLRTSLETLPLYVVIYPFGS